MEEEDGKGLWRRMMEDHLKHNESRLNTEMYQHHHCTHDVELLEY